MSLPRPPADDSSLFVPELLEGLGVLVFGAFLGWGLWTARTYLLPDPYPSQLTPQLAFAAGLAAASFERILFHFATRSA